ncbi:palmitoyltransferase ZDHHC6 [Euwallacea similis]|uniref:palmitoyltransferase ZDHHC6 n=1 Tax=Euwallacea similis TaxID=1736056 RepID=UPI00344EE9A8
MSLGIFKRVCHWGPLTAIGIVKLVTGSTIHCSGMWWPSTSLSGFLNTLCFMSLSGLTLFNLLSAMFHGPGYLPLRWMPKDPNDCQYLQHCGVCQGYKAPRSHHCRKCGRCVQKMDHHCPWINNCVGWGNHAHFTYFLLFATLGCFHASIVLGCSLYRALYRKNYLYYQIPNVPIVHLGLAGMVTTVLSLGFAIGVVVAVGMLLIVQISSILGNRTGIEDWILEKANHRRMNTNDKFIYPYNLGKWKNILQVLTLSGQPVGNGINWPVRDGCDQFTLTIEQIEQKREKRLKSRNYKIIKPASGYWFPIVHGIKVCSNYPCTNEPRLKLNVDDMVVVTRWRKHWLFGEKVQENLSQEQIAVLRQRGWFPRPCAILITDHSNGFIPENSKKVI